MFRRTGNIRRTKRERRYYFRRQETEERRQIQKDVEVIKPKENLIETKVSYSQRLLLHLPLQHTSKENINSATSYKTALQYVFLLGVVVVVIVWLFKC